VGDQEADLENVTRLRIAEAGRWAVGQEWGLTPQKLGAATIVVLLAGRLSRWESF